MPSINQMTSPTQYTIHILNSTKNPEREGWVNDGYVFHYLNAEPGNSFLFRYIPYNRQESLIEDRVFLADKSKDAIHLPQDTYSERNTVKPAIHVPDWSLAIARNRLEAIIQNGFDANLRSAVGWIIRLIDLERKRQEGVELGEYEIASRIEVAQEALKRLQEIGHPISEFEYAVLHTYATADDKIPIHDAIKQSLEIGEHRVFPKGAIEIGKILIGFMESLRQGIDLWHRIGSVEAPNIGLAAYYRLGQLNFDVNRDALIHYDTVDAEPTVLDADILRTEWVDRPDPQGYLNDHLEIGSLLTVRQGWAYSTESGIMTRPDSQGYLYSLFKTVRRPDPQGAHYDTLYWSERSLKQLTNDFLAVLADPALDTQAIVVKTLLTEANDSKHGYTDVLMQLTERDELLSMIMQTPILTDNHYNNVAAVYDPLRPTELAHDHQVVILQDAIHADKRASQGIMEAGSQLHDDASTKHSIVEHRTTLTSGAVEKQGHLDTTVIMASQERVMQAIIDSDQVLAGKEKTVQGHIDYVSVVADRAGLQAMLSQHVLLSELGKQDAQIVSQINFSDTSGISSAIINPHTAITNKTGKTSSIIYDISVRALSVPHSAEYQFVDIMAALIPESAILSDLMHRMEKVKTQAAIIHIIADIDRLAKASLIIEFWPLYEKISKHAQEILSKAYARAEAENGGGAILHETKAYEKAEKEYKEFLLNHLLSADPGLLDSILLELIGADIEKRLPAILHRINPVDRNDKRDIAVARETLAHRKDAVDDGVKINPSHTAVKPDMIGIVRELIISQNEDKQSRPAYIPGGYLLVGDISDWDDIWRRYTPGVDIIDVPTSDYNYEQLANQVYDPETGVPLNPIGPTNKADVKVRLPLHHPLPANADIGITEVIVDNFVLIDVILALESLKKRNSLRYAGMPAERAMRELMSKLYAWIQQVAANNLEYDRCFRMARWYGEAAVIKLSEHILHRTYDPWKSKLHLSEDLGVPYTADGWKYFLNESIMQTTSTDAKLTFHKTNYIDGQFTVRGFFDNPRGEGYFAIKVDGQTMSELTSSDNGIFTRVFDIPAGSHEIELHFTGASGRVSISSIEITGCEFVSAFTTSDDSNTNGLKAMTTLINSLLTYYDLHHGDGKTKGTMAIKQRKLWQQT